MLRACVILVCAIVLAAASLSGQTASSSRARIEAVITRSLQASRPVGLSADTITLTGDVLHLNGRVRIVIRPDTLIQADDTTLDRGNRTVELKGNVRASLGPSSGVQLPDIRIDYR